MTSLHVTATRCGPSRKFLLLPVSLLVLARFAAAAKPSSSAKDKAPEKGYALLQEEVLRSDDSQDGPIIAGPQAWKFASQQPVAQACIPDLPLTFSQTGLLVFLGMATVVAIVALLLRGCFLTAPAAGSAIPASESKGRRQLDVLNGMRPLLLTYVFFVHFPEGVPALASRMIAPGWPMQFFFVLSGFVRRYSMEGKAQFTWPSGLRWIGLRTLPLLPMYYLCLALDYARLAHFGVSTAGGDNGTRPQAAWVMSPLFLQSLLPVRFCGNADDPPTWNYAHFTGNGVGWFTASLVWANCCFPVLYNFLARRVRNISETAMLLAALVACRAVVEYVHPEWGVWGDGIMHLYAFAPLRILEYASGVLASHAAEQLPVKVRRTLGAAGAFDAMLVFSTALVLYINLSHLRWIECTGDFYLVPLWCYFCVTAQLGQEQQEQCGQGNCFQLVGSLQRLVSSQPLTALAPCGFAFYMVHQVALRLLAHFGAPAFMLTFGGNIVVAWLMGVILHHAYEQPVSRAVQSLLAPPRASLPKKDTTCSV